MMKAIQICMFATVLGLTGSWSDNSRAGEFDYPITRITNKIQVVFGPLDLPDSNNRGFRCNIVIVHTSKGIVLLDSGGSAFVGEWIARKLESAGEPPIVAVFNSHAHGDHWLGNEGIKRVHPQAIIYSHPNMKARVEGPEGERWLKTINRVTEGTAGGKRVVAPDRTVNNGDVITVGDTEFRVYHTGPGHTDNDIMVEIGGTNILFMGDLVRNGLIGIMEQDASFKGNIAAIDFMVKKQFKTYIPAHGRAGGVEVPKNYRAYLAAIRNTVKDLYAQGLVDYEMKPRVVEAVVDYKSWAGFEQRVGPHISRAYLEVEAEAF